MEDQAKKAKVTAPWNSAALDPQLKDKESVTNGAESDSDGENKSLPRSMRDTFINTPNMTRTPRGTDFRWADNQHIKKKPFVVGKPQDMDLKLTDTYGTVWVFPCCDATKEQHWDDAKWVAKANRWYDQVITRRLDKAHPEESTLRSMRPMWTVVEKAYLEMLIERKIRRVKNLLVSEDWHAITKAFNERFEGTIVRVGTPVAHATISKSDRPVKDPALRRLVIKNAHSLGSRSMLSLRSQMYRWADTRKMVEDLLAEYGIEDLGENTFEGDTAEQEQEVRVMDLTGESPDGKQNHKLQTQDAGAKTGDAGGSGTN